MRLWKYFFNIDVIGFILVFIGVLYFFFTTKRKKYPFLSPSKTKFSDSYRKKGVFRKKRRFHKVNKHEEKCREIFQKIFQKPFKSVRPSWLKNPVTNKNLELDGYCPGIKTPLGNGLAFEYDGVQHSKYSRHFHRRGPQEFLYQVKKDSWKDHRCKQEGVLLIRIPHFVAYEDLERYIVQKLTKHRLLSAR